MRIITDYRLEQAFSNYQRNKDSEKAKDLISALVRNAKFRRAEEVLNKQIKARSGSPAGLPIKDEVSSILRQPMKSLCEILGISATTYDIKDLERISEWSEDINMELISNLGENAELSKAVKKNLESEKGASTKKSATEVISNSFNDLIKVNESNISSSSDAELKKSLEILGIREKCLGLSGDQKVLIKKIRETIERREAKEEEALEGGKNKPEIDKKSTDEQKEKSNDEKPELSFLMKYK